MNLLKSNTLSPLKNKLFVYCLWFTSILCCFLVVLIFLFLLKDSVGFLASVEFKQLISSGWFPTEGQFNFTSLILASLLIMFGSVVLATPIGIYTAVFLNFYASKNIKKIGKNILDLMAGIPSVVYGFWGLVILVPIILKASPPGASLLAAIIVVALMIIPTIANIVLSHLNSLPLDLIQASQSQSLSRETQVFKIYLPSIKGGIVSSIILASGRAIGETMAVLMVSGNIVQVPKSIFDPVRAMTSNIALEMAYAVDTHRQSLFFCGFILIVIVSVLFFLSKPLNRRALT